MSGSLSEMPELQLTPYKAPDLLGMAGQATQLQGQLNTNRLFASQQQQNRLLTQNTNPDGTVNVPGYEQAIANTPGAQMGASDALQNAANVNIALKNATGLDLNQHFQRLKALADGLQSLNVASNGQGVPAADFKSAILSAYQQKLITASEAANEMSQVSSDPMQNAQRVRELDAGVGGGLQAIAPHLIAQSTGNGTITEQDNPGASGGAYMPNIVNGVPQPQLAAPTSYVGPNNQTINTTVGGYDSLVGQPTGAQIGGGIAAGGAQPMQPRPTGPLPVIGGNAQGLPAPAAPNSPATPNAPAGSIPGPAPGLADTQTFNTQQFNDDTKAGANISPRISTLQELAAAAPGAQTGGAASELAMLRGLGQEFGINVGTDQASQEQVMQKATAMLSSQNLVNAGGPSTDAGLMNAIGATPNAKMTPEAVGATVAMTYGQALYQQNLAAAAKNWIAQGNSPTNYLSFKMHYQATNPSPLVLSLPYMPPKSFQSVYKYIKTLPPKDQSQIEGQIRMMQNGAAPGQ